MNTASLPNQSTTQTQPDADKTVSLPDPGKTQRIAWTPPTSPPRLTVTPGGGPVSDPRIRLQTLRGVCAIAAIIFLLACLTGARRSPESQPVPNPPPIQQVAILPLPQIPASSNYNQPPVQRVTPHHYAVAPSAPIPDNSSFGIN